MHDVIEDQAIEINNLREIIKGQALRIDQLETVRNTTNATAPPVRIPDFREILREEKDRDSRKCNLILFNLNESEDDNEVLYEVVKKIKNDIPTTDITLIKRLGKPSAALRPRPLLITLKKSSIKFDLLSGSSQLRKLPVDDPHRQVVVKPDLTKQQQEENKRLVVEMKRRRDAGEHVKINKGKIITFIPNAQLLTIPNMDKMATIPNTEKTAAIPDIDIIVTSPTKGKTFADSKKEKKKKGATSN